MRNALNSNIAHLPPQTKYSSQSSGTNVSIVSKNNAQPGKDSSRNTNTYLFNPEVIYNCISGHESLDLIIIGAGQAGLALGARIKEWAPAMSTLILDRHARVGDSWRSRYDSLQLFTPRKYSQLPNLSLPGDPEGFPNRDEMANYMERYAAHYNLPIVGNCNVTAVQLVNQNHTTTRLIQQPQQEQLNEPIAQIQNNYSCKGRFHLTIHGFDKPLCCKQLVLAHGAFSAPAIPEWAQRIDSSIAQFHSSSYLGPEQLSAGNVLVIGGGNSGAQIAVELSRTHQVSFSVRSSIRHLPLRMLGRSTFEWMDALGFLHAPTDSWRARILRRQGDPIFGYELKEALRAEKIQLLSTAMEWDSTSSSVVFADGSTMSPVSIVWATGFKQDNDWIKAPNLCNPQGQINYRGHHTPIPKLFVIGMPWQQARSSALICGAGRDAAKLAADILEI
ncbi:flavin-containing monooxygenase [Paenibacillus agilis]|uniref:Pyridine nucleotide-disulfide oxidoreductase n=1 Tax=Paenibacillus agilis TaxID=3020863 RepID=A0A559IHS7_9BACL|nr:NAD(P)/FAD-dependent oxidoreductase [Paenibacillus agilis]TVX87060.1 pyridine nucleotide-disulfide oxidoreductase [Paenibacillus agilis]